MLVSTFIFFFFILAFKSFLSSTDMFLAARHDRLDRLLLHTVACGVTCTITIYGIVSKNLKSGTCIFN